jgi:hypothetical protein
MTLQPALRVAFCWLGVEGRIDLQENQPNSASYKRGPVRIVPLTESGKDDRAGVGTREPSV